MKTVVVDGKMIGSVRELHSYFSKELGFPEWYGNNLDALYDLLSERSQKDLCIVLKNEKNLEKALGKKYAPFISVLEDLEKNRCALIAREKL